MSTTPDYAGLIEWLEGVYRVPITDGLGAVGAGEEPDNPDMFVRKFETPPIQKEAATALRTLLESNAALERERDELKHDVSRYVEIASDEATRAETAEARVREFEAERDDWKARVQCILDPAYLTEKLDEIGVSDLEARALAAEARLAEAMRVIEPFAKAGELFPNVSPGEIEYDQCVYLPAAGDEYALAGSHLRAARALKENGGLDVE